jgi:hypothetical protein
VTHHLITGHLAFAPISTECLMMFAVIDDPANCHIHSVIYFDHAKNINAIYNNHQLSTVYGTM